MNDRIEQLARQCTEYITGTIDGDFEKFDYKKFSELIVLECADQCDLLLDHKMSSEWARGTHDCSKAIKKHFGLLNHE